ncbi:dTDP-4-dehydrorhamnose reductase [Aphanothece hegewaldii CCALA 016]|uniref:dTDP-4-dehydrorhamnose reductase n=1 Tax=Aphanothece hegewaldii CCALA 016 TaxID=2107694 RepID=A0A2T1LXZ6_9CHRO|nr:family 1 glycosylhydrolase [Aphanothece hegewaldii]PSF37257.1 dTDP-4-dehydrorhamnose reductase [Aphanothece hegewaldii CCALA 016]
MATLINSKQPLEIWAGVECTVNRVGDEYFDQLERNGHAKRIEDLELFALMGITAMRYPVLWEKIAPNGLDSADWSWADLRLKRLQELEIRPIVGLVHHGSGPPCTSLIDPEFPEKLALYAGAIAKRYPWVMDYTPINEPLTTARFSGLYGHWYPHGRDNLTFARALLGQCRGIIQAMRAIRQINPHAKMIQTEDLGKVYSSPILNYQADFENERRWLSFDLLCGKVTPDHPMWHYLRYCGITETELAWFLENFCPPDIMGINYYLTSDRYLDEQIEQYPTHCHGGNGKHQYADVEAVRVRAEGITGHYTILKEVWQRYQLPLAVTEVHLNCTREEQLRWLYEAWNDALKLQQEGIDIRSITAWAILGSYDWNSLVTRSVGHYESGVFDLRAPQPRATALARLIRNLTTGNVPTHPILDIPGWWHRSKRLLYSQSVPDPIRVRPSPRPLLIIGATGTLGKAFARLCETREISYRLLSRHEMDITNPASVETVLEQFLPWAVVNAAGYVRVDDAEREPDTCFKINTEGAATLAMACERHGAILLTFSSDLVFDGTGSIPYVESDAIAPINVYGHSKAIAEERVLQAHHNALIIRTSAFFGPWDEYNFVTLALRQLKAGQPFLAAEDVLISPTYVPDLVHASLDLLIDGEYGVWHLTNQEAITWADLARMAAKEANISVTPLVTLPMREMNLIAPRPSYSVLGSNKGHLLPCLESAMSRYFRD